MTVDPREVFPDRLASRMAERSVSAVDVVVALRVQPQDVESWLDGTGFPCPRSFDGLLRILDCARDELLT